MEVFLEGRKTGNYYCLECSKFTSHLHSFYIKEEGKYLVLRKCSICGQEAGSRVLNNLTDKQKQQWEDMKNE